MMNGLKDLLASERGIFAIVLALSSTALAIVGPMTIEQWLDFNKWISAFLIGSKTITTGIEMFRSRAPAPAATPTMPIATATATAPAAPTP